MSGESGIAGVWKILSDLAPLALAIVALFQTWIARRQLKIANRNLELLKKQSDERDRPKFQEEKSNYFKGLESKGSKFIKVMLRMEAGVPLKEVLVSVDGDNIEGISKAKEEAGSVCDFGPLDCGQKIEFFVLLGEDTQHNKRYVPPFIFLKFNCSEGEGGKRKWRFPQKVKVNSYYF